MFPIWDPSCANTIFLEPPKTLHVHVIYVFVDVSVTLYISVYLPVIYIFVDVCIQSVNLPVIYIFVAVSVTQSVNLPVIYIFFV